MRPFQIAQTLRWRDYTTYAKPCRVTNKIPTVAKGDDEIINTVTNNKSCLLNEQGDTTTAINLFIEGYRPTWPVLKDLVLLYIFLSMNELIKKYGRA